eukprot:maker-scaffold18_size714446-snap-gene-5.19 protein:Tk08488 transcript:maker-scaffold18_size714446-snap-gene-5.19-mRNA-1 annotation:"---NA---"
MLGGKVAFLLALTICIPTSGLTAVPFANIGGTGGVGGLGSKLGLGGQAPIATLDTLEDAKNNLLEDITRPFVRTTSRPTTMRPTTPRPHQSSDINSPNPMPPTGINPPSQRPPTGINLPIIPGIELPTKSGLFGRQSAESFNRLAISGAAIGLSALKINSILVAPLIGLGAKLAAPIITLQAKVAAPFIFKGVLLAKPLIKTGAKIIAPTIKLAQLTSQRFQGTTQPLRNGVIDALSPITNAFRPVTNAARPIPDAAARALGREDLLQDEVRNVRLQTELGTINREFDVITREFNNIVTGQMTGVRSVRNRRSMHDDNYANNQIKEVSDDDVPASMLETLEEVLEMVGHGDPVEEVVAMEHSVPREEVHDLVGQEDHVEAVVGMEDANSVEDSVSEETASEATVESEEESFGSSQQSVISSSESTQSFMESSNSNEMSSQSEESKSSSSSTTSSDSSTTSADSTTSFQSSSQASTDSSSTTSESMSSSVAKESVILISESQVPIWPSPIMANHSFLSQKATG